jgi:membrane peptidoglycan carboxypeptidase
VSTLFVLGFVVTFAVVAWPKWKRIESETLAMADLHLRHETAHPGWSFPGTVYSAPANLDLPKKRLIEHAKARGYTEQCPPKQPGEFCGKDGAVVPRGGHFPEGDQPAGLEGWSRPLALEPVPIGNLISPDGEIRWHLPLEEAPPHLIAALFASEDEDYRTHIGVNPMGIARAAWVNFQGGGIQQGASTITMQVVRNLSQDKERSVQRKIREILAAVALDRGLGKDEVLQIYLDAPYLGQHGSYSVCGFEAASQYYYGIPAAEMSLSQAATLASILPAPAKYAPDSAPERAKARRDRTLRLMKEAGWDAAEVDAALAEPIVASPHALPDDRYPAYMQATRSWLEANLDDHVVYGSGLQVHTALDLVAQDTSDELIPKQLKYLERAVGRRGKEPLEAAGAVVDSKTGLLVAAYGGRQALATDFNRATQARRQAGSSIKPLVYAMAFTQRDDKGERVWSADSTIDNHRHTFKNTNGWTPRNVGGQYSTTSTLAMGLAWSQNVATASLLEAIGGPVPFKQFAAGLGYETGHWRDELGLSLGTGEVTPLEQARFVATVVADGQLASGRPVVVAADRVGQVRVERELSRPYVMEPDDAALTRGIMRLVITYGTGGASRGAAGHAGYTGPAIGKTGTTDAEKDLWFIGGTPHYAMALWLGYDQPQRIGASASDLAAPLWGWWARAVHVGLPEDEFGGVQTTGRGVCTQSGKYGNGTCRLIGAPFLPDEKPKGRCPIGHPPPDPEAKKYEGLWKRKAREAEEREAGG